MSTRTINLCHAVGSTCFLLLVLWSAGIARTAPSSAATANSNVGVTVLSSTQLVTTGCATGTTGITSFGSVLAASTNVTTSDCVVQFGSSNDTARLRIRQSDRSGYGMWQWSKGDLDTTFGTSGIITQAMSAGAGDDRIESIAINEDGVFTVAGRCAGTGFDFCVNRYLANGTLDTSFDTDGKVKSHIGTNNDYPRTVVLQPDGKTIVAGSCTFAVTADDFCIVRYTTSGGLDPTWGTGGVAHTNIATYATNPYDYVDSLLLLTDGSLLAAGTCAIDSVPSSGSGWAGMPCIAKYTSAGVLDTSFGTSGVTVVLYAPPSGLTIRSDGYRDPLAYDAPTIALDGSGRIVMAGETAFLPSQGRATFIRMSSAGVLDATFGTGGVAYGPGVNNAPRGITFMPDGKLLIAQETGNSGGMRLMRLNTDGSADATYGTGGQSSAYTPAGSPPGGSGFVLVPWVLPDGDVLAPGGCSDTTTGRNFCSVRFNSDGTLDTAFGTGNVAMTSIGTAAVNAQDQANAAVQTSDGGYIIGGFCNMSGSGNDFCMAKYRAADTAAQYGVSGSTWSADNTHNLFAACARTVTNATADAAWTPNDANPLLATCPAADAGVSWNAIPTTLTSVAATSSTGATASVGFRFGMKSTSAQVPGTYVAPIEFNVIAPAA